MSAPTHLVGIYGTLLLCGALALDTWKVASLFRGGGDREVKRLQFFQERRSSEAAISVMDEDEHDRDFVEFVYEGGKKEMLNKDGHRNMYKITNKHQKETPSLNSEDTVDLENMKSTTISGKYEGVITEKKADARKSGFQQGQISKKINENKNYDLISQFENEEKSLTDPEENSPGSKAWPKHLPYNLRSISPFPEAKYVLEKIPTSYSSRQQKRDEQIYMPDEKVMPPQFAGPGLFPLSMFDREFRVPFV